MTPFELLVESPTSPAERLEIISTICRRWLPGVAAQPLAASLPARVETIPPVLSAFFEIIAPFKSALFRQNYFLTSGEPRVEGDRLVFYCENQTVCRWATSATADDPLVYGQLAGIAEWFLEEPTLSGFLVQAVLLELGLGGKSYGASASWLDPNVVAGLARQFKELPFGSWRFPAYPTRLFVRPDSVMVVAPNEGGFSVYVSCLSRDEAAFLGPVVDETWDFVKL